MQWISSKARLAVLLFLLICILVEVLYYLNVSGSFQLANTLSSFRFLFPISVTRNKSFGYVATPNLTGNAVSPIRNYTDEPRTTVIADTSSTSLLSSLTTSRSTFTSSASTTQISTDGTSPCPQKPPNLLGSRTTVNLDSKLHVSWAELEAKYPTVTSGEWKPDVCTALQKVAIVIPYRNREVHLKVLLRNLIPFLQRQQLNFRVFIIDQDDDHRFNRGALFNIGYLEVSKLFNASCYILHDVDLVPENDHNLYKCGSQPRHMSVAVDKFNYRLPYATLFGGAVAVTSEQFLKINGFSNRFFGWGGEDDDFSSRRAWAGYQISRYPISIARYKMIRHGSDKGNSPNPQRFQMIKEGRKHWKTDGVTTTKYHVIEIVNRKLYTQIKVSVDNNQPQ